jgi:hypothetical protein
LEGTLPKFILDHGSPEAANGFKALDTFTQGYIEAMFFTSTGSADDEELEHATVADLAPETLDKIRADCAKFQVDNRANLDEAIDCGRINGYDDEAAGRDFWYSRNGHGVGFWDRDLGEIGDRLHEAAKHREVSLYEGDDNRLYLS